MDGKSLWKGGPCNFSQFWPKCQTRWPHLGYDPLSHLTCSHPISLIYMEMDNPSAPGKEQGSLKHRHFTAWVVRPRLPKSKECCLDRAIIYSDKGSWSLQLTPHAARGKCYTASSEFMATYLWLLQRGILQTPMWGKWAIFKKNILQNGVDLMESRRILPALKWFRK